MNVCEHMEMQAWKFVKAFESANMGVNVHMREEDDKTKF